MSREEKIKQVVLNCVTVREMGVTYIRVTRYIHTCSIGLITIAEQIGQQSVLARRDCSTSVLWRTHPYIESLRLAGTCATGQLI